MELAKNGRGWHPAPKGRKIGIPPPPRMISYDTYKALASLLIMLSHAKYWSTRLGSHKAKYFISPWLGGPSPRSILP